MRYTPDRQAGTFPNRISVQKCESCLWLGKGAHSRQLFLLRLCESRRQPMTINFGHPVLRRMLFRTLDTPSCFAKARASKTTTLKTYASVHRNSIVLISKVSRINFWVNTNNRRRWVLPSVNPISTFLKSFPV